MTEIFHSFFINIIFLESPFNIFAFEKLNIFGRFSYVQKGIQFPFFLVEVHFSYFGSLSTAVCSRTWSQRVCLKMQNIKQAQRMDLKWGAFFDVVLKFKEKNPQNLKKNISNWFLPIFCKRLETFHGRFIQIFIKFS